jgi:hypothetical protein
LDQFLDRSHARRRIGAGRYNTKEGRDEMVFVAVRSRARRRIGAGRYNSKERRDEMVFVASKKAERSGP